jgi:hypothetical protein
VSTLLAVLIEEYTSATRRMSAFPPARGHWTMTLPCCDRVVHSARATADPSLCTGNTTPGRRRRQLGMRVCRWRTQCLAGLYQHGVTDGFGGDRGRAV